MKVTKRQISALVVAFLGLVIGNSSLVAYAENGGVNVAGKLFEFGEKNHYEFSSTNTYSSTEYNDGTYGMFTIAGNITDTGEINGIASYGVESGYVSLSYTYGNSLLIADEDEWHLVDDKSKTVDDIDLDDKIMKGILILQTSKDGQIWLDDVILKNIFEDTPTQTESFYTTKDVQLANGCYYRIIVAYKTRIQTGTTLFGTVKNYDYKKYAEVYEFYVHSNSVTADDKNTLRYSLGYKVNAGKDTGYYEENEIDEDDPHYGWDLGTFFVSGYTRNTKDDSGNPVFLKNVGDTVTLFFNLQQDIDILNGNEALSIAEDKDGYDQYFETAKTNYGHGTLIIRYTDYKNVKNEPTIYANYLEASASTGADTIVQLFEEGDYEIALDYEIKNDKRQVFGKSILPKYTDYRIFFKFSVRNGNCMVYPFDVTTKSELTNSSLTENGFYLDLAKSRYLEINVKKEILNDSSNGLIEDTRFNKPAKDGDQYTEEGIYTITVRNQYTNQTTTKKIYVGTNNILKGYITTGLSISEINNQIDQGARIDDEGKLIPVSSSAMDSHTDNAVENSLSEVSNFEQEAGYENSSLSEDRNILLIVIGFVTVAIVVLLIVTYKKIKVKKALQANVIDSDNESLEEGNGK